MRYFKFFQPLVVSASITTILHVTLLIITLPEPAYTKCVMREPCHASQPMSNAQDPFEVKWLNCKYDSEPLKLETQSSVEEFKKICPMLFNGKDDMQVCCSSNQLDILKRDLSAAEAIIGSCASCYINFRTLWCHMTCDPNQSDFIKAIEFEAKTYRNFSAQLERNIKFKLEQLNEPEHVDLEAEAKNLRFKRELVETIKKQAKKLITTTSAQDSENQEEDYDDGEEEKDTAESEHAEAHKVEVVSKIAYYLKEEFVARLIESCRDIKLYGSDALMSLCGVSSKLCTPKDFAGYMGLQVGERPFDIHFIYSVKENTNLTFSQTSFDENQQKQVVQHEFLIKSKMPTFHRCNESFQYGDFDYGAKCSCKDCQASCEIYDEFLISPKRRFKIGHADGLPLIMSILFVIFLISFLNSISVFSCLFSEKPKPQTQTQIPNRIYLKQTFLARLRKRFSSTSTKTTPTEQPDFGDTKPSNRYQRLTRRLGKLNFLDKMLYFGEKLERFIEIRFTRMGKFCATYPTLVLIIGLAFCSIMCLGYFNFKIEKDPIKLWSSDTSIARQNKKYFDENFTPFYRITQLIIEPKNTIQPLAYTDPYNSNKTFAITALQKHVLTEIFGLYSRILGIKANDGEVSLNDICFKPLAPLNKNCATQSLFEYWQNDAEKFKESLSENTQFTYLTDCMKNPFEVNCLSSFGGPVHPFMAIGSYQNEAYLNAGSIIITFVINNYLNNKEEIQKAMAWEAEVLLLLKNYTSEIIDVSYTTERSIEDELERESKADIKIVCISYIMMFFYLTITLGKYSSLKLKVILLEMKIFLALAGVFLVLLSVFSSGGIFTYLGVPATLITLEVIPFLLLAVGVDNVYILVQTYQNDERLPNETIEDQIARIVGKVGPSMLLTGTTQSAAFLISALTPMPGVRAFSLYASLAIILNFLMQITCFVVLLTIDAKREESKRMDLLCCIKLNVKDSDGALNGRKSFLHKFFKNVYTPLLLNNYVRAIVIIVFIGFFFACLAMCDKIKVGLDQKLTMPTDSYQIKYFEALQKHLAVGPPVYFVLKDGYNYTDTDSLRRICGASACESNSLQSLISSASFFPNETFIAQATVNWIDDYMEWLQSGPPSASCCYVFKNTTRFCDYKKLSDESSSLAKECEWCQVDRVKYKLPSEESFLKYIKHFLNQNPSRDCIKAGHAMYGDAVKLITDKYDTVTRIGPSHFMAYHKVLSTSDDFVNAMVSANQISDSITKMLNKNSKSNIKHEVFPYSIFYVFYEQYLTIWQDATMQLILTLAAIFICTFVLLSFDLFTALIVTGLIAIIIIDMVGIMFLWNIELNAISLVNLVIAIGISVEFCSHIARAFATSNAKTRKERASEALFKMGPPVFSGVLQSIVGISVLAFAHSQLFQVFYFRMYFSILMLGLTHGLIFLPVLLSYIGRSTNHLAYFKVAQNINLELDNFEIDPQLENVTIAEDQVISTTSPVKKNSVLEHQVPITPQEQDEITTRKNLNKTNKISNKFHNYFNSPKSNRKDNGRDSPISKKSIDLLLNDQNSINENDSVNSSNNSETNSQEINETNVDKNGDICEDQMVQLNQSFSSKLNSFFKFNKDKDREKPSTKRISFSSSVNSKNHQFDNGDADELNSENQYSDLLSNSLNYKIKLNEDLIANKNRTKSVGDTLSLNLKK